MHRGRLQEIKKEILNSDKKFQVDNNILNHPDYEDEVLHLERTIDEMKQEIKNLESNSSQVYSKQKELLATNNRQAMMDLNVYSNVQKGISKTLQDMKSAIDSPYFGRVDFKEEDSDEIETLYIGKVGFNQESKYGVIDWRTPIASIFYDCENGVASYEAPGGTFLVDVKLKRQYKIKNSKLISFSDDFIADRIAKKIGKIISKEEDNNINIDKKDNDNAIFIEKLKENSDKKLKDIIETIRAEQNRIIRQPLNKVLVVQGVAGSGKSSVGLHRISYILYNNRSIKPNKILVVAPNKVFLDYISEFLPDIDAQGIKQLTFEQLAFNIIGINLNVVKDEKIEFFVNNEKGNLYQFLKEAMINVSKFKGDLSFINLIEYIINKKSKEIISKLKDIDLFEGELKISKDEQISCLNTSEPLNNKIRTLKRVIEFRVKVFIEQKTFFTNKEKELRQEAVKFLNSYLKNIKEIEVISLYKELYEDDYVYKILYKNRYFSFVAQYTLKILEAGGVEREDLAALCYIKYKLDGINYKKKYEHIFVDEAQDLSPLEFIVLKLVLENNSMTIMGDMNQGINSHRGIKSWEELIKDIYSELKPEYFEILNSYRSTKQIVEFANKLIPKNFSKAIPVDRNGEDPIIEKFLSYKDGIIKVIKIIKYYQDKGCKSIGILAKKEKECRAIYSALLKIEDNFENINLINDTTDKYNGGISIVPIVLSKGLEFDAVILWNASDKNFSYTDFDLKILYVAVTRPMHYLHILYKGNIIEHLKKFI
ncbi:HelD family protein [Defluviitalea phaphyphila]|uniref:HelD family protein n=1 Tax=Defluviitalea phaphyphila TaxID=1473580 RepID=UPI000730BD16|nr:UvrD-helicase domain-containing protein [Defluviitalea phaphyphila]